METSPAHKVSFNRRSFLKGLGAAGGGTALLAACGPLGSPAAPKAEGDVSVWVFPLTGDDKLFWDPLMAKFKQENPKINPKVEVLPWAGRLQKMLTAVAGGAPPDIAYLNRDFVPRFVEEQAIVGIDDLLARDLQKDFRKEVWDQNKYRGKIWNSPILLSLYVPFHNTGLATQAGLDPNKLPTTWQEHEEWAARLTKPAEQWGISHPWSTETATGTLYNWIWEAGGELIEEPDGKKALFNTAAGVDGLRWIKGVFDKGYIQDADKSGQGVAFSTGRIGTMFWGSNPTPVELKKDAPTMQFKVGHIPQGKKRVAYGTLAGYAIFAKAPNRGAAEPWIRFMAKADNAAQLLKPTGYMPPWASLEAQALWPGDEHRARMVEEMQYVRLDPQHVFARDMSKILAEEGQLALLNKKTPEQALADGAKRLEDTIAKGV
jgi:multiple sugar transport system substrate-binding protein